MQTPTASAGEEPSATGGLGGFAIARIMPVQHLEVLSKHLTSVMVCMSAGQKPTFSGGALQSSSPDLSFARAFLNNLVVVNVLSCCMTVAFKAELQVCRAGAYHIWRLWQCDLHAPGPAVCLRAYA